MPDRVAVSPDGQSSTYDYGASGTGPTATALVDRALARMSDQLDPYDAARQLLTRWVEHDSSLSHLLPDALLEIEAREQRSESQGGKKRAAKQRESGVKVGDLALIASSMGPAFYRVVKVITDATGKVTALTLADLHRTTANTGQPVAIERITAVIADVLNTQE